MSVQEGGRASRDLAHRRALEFEERFCYRGRGKRARAHLAKVYIGINGSSRQTRAVTRHGPHAPQQEYLLMHR